VEYQEGFSALSVTPWRNVSEASARQIGARTSTLAIDLVGGRTEAVKQRFGQGERDFSFAGEHALRAGVPQRVDVPQCAVRARRESTG
jgi:hypothetical protein